MFAKKPPTDQAASTIATARARPSLDAFKGADGAISVLLGPEGVAEPGGVGVRRVDPDRHDARLFVQTGRVRREEDALETVRKRFEPAWGPPTDPGIGQTRN
jgi:hypothetical protein